MSMPTKTGLAGHRLDPVRATAREHPRRSGVIDVITSTGRLWEVW
jgi:hypothetical protein